MIIFKCYYKVTHSYCYATSNVIMTSIKAIAFPPFLLRSNRLYHKNPIMLYNAIQGGFGLNRTQRNRFANLHISRLYRRLSDPWTELYLRFRDIIRDYKWIIKWELSMQQVSIWLSTHYLSTHKWFNVGKNVANNVGKKAAGIIFIYRNHTETVILSRLLSSISRLHRFAALILQLLGAPMRL